MEKKNLHYKLSKCLFTAADNWILIAFHSWLIFFLLFHPFLNFFKFIYPLILSVSQFNFSEILKMSNHSRLCSVNRTGLKRESGVCQELLCLVSVRLNNNDVSLTSFLLLFCSINLCMSKIMR